MNKISENTVFQINNLHMHLDLNIWASMLFKLIGRPSKKTIRKFYEDNINKLLQHITNKLSPQEMEILNKYYEYQFSEPTRVVVNETEYHIYPLLIKVEETEIGE